MSIATATHILIDDAGVAWIDGTKTKVLEIVMDKLTYGWSPEEISFQHYGTLSLSQIHAAFSYYYDHQAEIDADIAKQAKDYEAQRLGAPETPGRAKLRALGLRP